MVLVWIKRQPTFGPTIDLGQSGQLGDFLNIYYFTFNEYHYL